MDLKKANANEHDDRRATSILTAKTTGPALAMEDTSPWDRDARQIDSDLIDPDDRMLPDTYQGSLNIE